MVAARNPYTLIQALHVMAIEGVSSAAYPLLLEQIEAVPLYHRDLDTPFHWLQFHPITPKDSRETAWHLRLNGAQFNPARLLSTSWPWRDRSDGLPRIYLHRDLIPYLVRA